MGKARIGSGDKFVEFDLDDPYGRELARELAREHLGLAAIVKLVEAPAKVARPSPAKKVKGKQLDLDEEELIATGTSESTARKAAPGKYFLYRNKQTGSFTGLLETPTQTVKIALGNPADPASKLAQVKKAVMNMSYFEPFSRRQLSGSLPKSVSGRGEVIKFALDYLEEEGMIVKLEQKERSTNALLYQRINEKKRDAPAAQSVEDGAKAIPR